MFWLIWENCLVSGLRLIPDCTQLGVFTGLNDDWRLENFGFIPWQLEIEPKF
jgi:hypothetical protein